MGKGQRNGTKVHSTHPLLAEIQRHLDEEVDLAGLAEKFGYSPFHFHRAFSRAVGETPREHISRLRLEKALLLVVVTPATILDIALAVGFQNHETFTRAFARHFGETPSALRRRNRSAARQLQPPPAESGTLSAVRVRTLPRQQMLAVRRMGAYDGNLAPPYLPDDPYWSGLAAWASARGVNHDRLPYGFYLDMPGITPAEAMRADLAIAVEGVVSPEAPYFHFVFEGGLFAMIEHRGAYATLPRAYYTLVDAILAMPEKFVLTGAPPFEIHREVHVDGDPAANRTEVYFPVSRA